MQYPGSCHNCPTMTHLNLVTCQSNDDKLRSEIHTAFVGADLAALFVAPSDAKSSPTTLVGSGFAGLEKHRFSRHPFDARAPRPAQVIDYAKGVDTGLRPYGMKFEYFRVSSGCTKHRALTLERVPVKIVVFDSVMHA